MNKKGSMVRDEIAETSKIGDVTHEERRKELIKSDIQKPKKIQRKSVFLFGSRLASLNTNPS